MNAIKHNRFPVTLTARKEHLETLKDLLENKIRNLIVMKGGMGRKQRQAGQVINPEMLEAALKIRFKGNTRDTAIELIHQVTDGNGPIF